MESPHKLPGSYSYVGILWINARVLTRLSLCHLMAYTGHLPTGNLQLPASMS